VNLPADNDAAYECRMTNEQLSGLKVVKFERLAKQKPRAAIGRWIFTLDGGPAAVHIVKTTNRSGSTHKMNFGRSLRPGNYTLCERPFAGWDPDFVGLAEFTDQAGNNCALVTLAAGQVVKVKAINTCTKSRAPVPR
jgi:hypothetical protein